MIPMLILTKKKKKKKMGNGHLNHREHYIQYNNISYLRPTCWSLDTSFPESKNIANHSKIQ